MTADELRDSILLSAVKGTLVPQDATAPSASLLIKEIEREKAAMISERKILKPIKTAPFTDEDELFDIPKGWQWCRLGDLLSVVSDGTHQTPKYVDHGIPFLSVQNISSGHLDLSKAKYISEEEHKILTGRIRPQYGDILICRIGTLGKALEVTWTFDFSIFVSLGILRPIDGRLTPFILTAINSPWGKQWIDRVKVGGGTHTNKINLSVIPSFPIPLPPLEEQRRIIAKIEELSILVDEYGKAAVELNSLNELLPDKLRTSVLREAFNGNLISNDIPYGEATAPELLQQILKERQDRESKAKGIKAKKLTLSIVEEEPWELPEGWCWCLLPEVASIEYGFAFDSTKFNSKGQGMPLIRIRDVVPGQTKTYTTEIVNSNYVVHKGDMLTGMDGNFNVNFWNAEEAYLNQRVCKITSYGQALEQKYLYYYLLSAFKVIEAGVSFVTVKHLSDKILKSLTVPLPPLSIQHRIVKKIEEVFAAIDQLHS